MISNIHNYEHLYFGLKRYKNEPVVSISAHTRIQALISSVN